jgi:anaerobic magnesium-protoporphyrin IX monomethyl ester cyclase
MRWQAERWMKMRHLPPAFAHNPGFVMRHGLAMLSHTFTGTSLRSLLGLESGRQVFERYRATRRNERESLQAFAADAPLTPQATA